MNPSQISIFKTKRARELTQLHSLLQRKFRNATPSLEPLRLAANQLAKEASLKDGNPIWGYSISNLVLPLGLNRHIEPQGITTLRIRIDCDLTCNIENWDKLNDPFISYRFAAIIFGEKGDVNYSICWHIDKHIDKDEDKESSEYHPLYHLQYSNGSNHFGKTNSSFNWGQLVYLDSPRFVHYPMDIILGIGFYLTNFQPKGLFEDFLKDPLFRQLYTQAKNQILKPYYYNLASHWDNVSQSKMWNSNILCPHLC